MNKEIISDKQAIALLVFIMTADSVVFAVAAQARKDFWIAKIDSNTHCFTHD